MAVAGSLSEDEDRRPCWTCPVVACTIALCWASSVFTVKQLQNRCGYSKPVLITYLHEFGLCLVCALLACVAPRPKGAPSLLQEARTLGLRACGFGALSFVANCCFTAALRLDVASTISTLEQLTPVFIALLSYCLLGERYGPVQLLGLAVALAGGITVANAPTKNSVYAPQPLVGDGLALVYGPVHSALQVTSVKLWSFSKHPADLWTCAAAGAYMVLFKREFAGTDFGWRKLFIFFTVKGLFVMAIGWAGVLPFEEFAIPSNACGWSYLSANTVLQIGFNVGLAWGTLAISPLAARLFILLGLPLALFMDVVEGMEIGAMKITGIALAIVGVITFEAASNRPLHDGASDESSSSTEASNDEACREA